MLVGYARVSTPDQDPGYQLKALEERGCEKVFTDRQRQRQDHRAAPADRRAGVHPGGGRAGRVEV